jgi:hypothetical protein
MYQGTKIIAIKSTYVENDGHISIMMQNRGNKCGIMMVLILIKIIIINWQPYYYYYYYYYYVFVSHMLIIWRFESSGFIYSFIPATEIKFKLLIRHPAICSNVLPRNLCEGLSSIHVILYIPTNSASVDTEHGKINYSKMCDLKFLEG